MTKLFILFLGFLLIKAVLVMLPTLIRNTMFSVIPRKKYTAEEVIKCGHMKPELYYKKQKKLKSKKNQTKLLPKNKYEEVDVNVIREDFKRKMKSRELTRNQIIAIRRYLETLVNCTGKKFSNDCHCIYWCLKRLEPQNTMDLNTLENLLK